MGLRTLVDKDRVVKIFSVEEKEDEVYGEVYVGTQESQVGRPNKPKGTEVKVSDSRISLPRWTGPFPKTMGSLNKGMPQPKSIGTSSRYMPQDKTMGTPKNVKAQSKPINVGKTKVQDVVIQDMVDVQVDEEDDSDEDVEFGGLNKKNTLSIDADYAAASGSNVGSVAGAQGSGQTVQSGGTMVKKARKVNQSEGGSIVMSK
ncbi:hypothetical protein RHGRI_027484 [Rhododendron griersonianum]|uniref:Uncharacterized protein n=1 Tax=Rhododendron griersonianum TaxID=479676 RepID=A0AAV6IWY3_9ERIC|nr:hypothetical protein RHGRI_027484 [Rhododendron griersonianum]